MSQAVPDLQSGPCRLSWLLIMTSYKDMAADQGQPSPDPPGPLATVGPPPMHPQPLQQARMDKHCWGLLPLDQSPCPPTCKELFLDTAPPPLHPLSSLHKDQGAAGPQSTLRLRGPP